MVRIYEQVDQAAPDGSIVACSGLAAANGTYNRELEASGTLGSGTNSVASNTATVERAIHLESEVNEPNETSWPSGDYVIRINVTTGNVNVEWDESHVCRVNSGGVSQATIGTLLAQAIALTAGVKTMTVSGSADAGAVATDRFYIVGGIKRASGAHGSQSATITNDQQVDTPFTDPAPALVERGVLRGVQRGVLRGV